MSTLLLQIEDESIALKIKEFIAMFKSVKIREIHNTHEIEDECAFNQDNFRETLREIKSKEAFNTAKPISDLFDKMENEW